jgi:outer membrane lipoprotein SlyB
MEVVSNHQSGSTRIKPLVVAVAAAATIAVLIALGAFTGMLPNTRRPMLPDEGPLARGELKPAQPGTCALCGTIESVRTVEVYDEPSAGAADPKNGAETAGAGPGGAIASGAASMLDSLGGFVPGSATDNTERNLRKRFVWRVTLRMDDGSFRAISLSAPPAFAVGEKVRVVEGHLVRA